MRKAVNACADTVQLQSTHGSTLARCASRARGCNAGNWKSDPVLTVKLPSSLTVPLLARAALADILGAAKALLIGEELRQRFEVFLFHAGDDARHDRVLALAALEIGRASCRERVWISGAAGP